MPLKQTTLQAIKDRLAYEPKTGQVFWRVSKRGIEAGKQAGSAPDNKGYSYIGVDGVRISYAKVCWILTHGREPDGDIDHINRVPSDNRIENLRDVSRTENLRNRGVMKNNRLSVKGVRKQGGRYQARIKVDGKLLSLGMYGTLEQAEHARMLGEKKYFIDMPCL